jgi:hypothetical protein
MTAIQYAQLNQPGNIKSFRSYAKFYIKP